MHLLERRTSRKIYFIILSQLHEFVTWEFGSAGQRFVFSSWFGCLSSRSVYSTALILAWSFILDLSEVFGQSPISRGPLKGPESPGCSRC